MDGLGFDREVSERGVDTVDIDRVCPKSIIFNLDRESNLEVEDKSILFKPNIESSDNGELELNFKTPDSLGRWRFMGLITF